MELHDACAKILATLGDFRVGQPAKLVLPRSSIRQPLSGTQAGILGKLLEGRLKQIVQSPHGWIEGLEQRPVGKLPVAIDLAAVGLFGARERNTMGLAWRRRSA